MNIFCNLPLSLCRVDFGFLCQYTQRNLFVIIQHKSLFSGEFSDHFTFYFCSGLGSKCSSYANFGILYFYRMYSVVDFITLQLFIILFLLPSLYFIWCIFPLNKPGAPGTWFHYISRSFSSDRNFESLSRLPNTGQDAAMTQLS